MSITPILTFKAGICDLDVSAPRWPPSGLFTSANLPLQTSTSPPHVKARSTPGYIYLYVEDELVHFCWRPRSAPLTDPEVDLVMVPSDGSFTPYKPATNGRIYVLKFFSSSQRYLFWLQSKSQDQQGSTSYFSPRDLKLGEIVNALLQGEEVDIQDEIAHLRNGSGGGGGDDDETMDDVEGVHHDPYHDHSGSGGGHGTDATGGDIREEGEESREGGANGGRA